MAQIMKFHRYPTNFNWDNMPDYDWQTDTILSSTPALIRSVGRAVKMIYGLTASGSSFENAGIAFRDTFKYNITATYYYDATQVKNEILNNKRPVYMEGSPDGWGFHAWVCDGAQEDRCNNVYYFVEYQFGGNENYTYNNLGYTSAAYPGIAGPYSYSSLYFHMNWGEKTLNNAWFLGDNVNSGGGNFKLYRKNLFVYPK
jgi:hypothetical protein